MCSWFVCQSRCGGHSPRTHRDFTCAVPGTGVQLETEAAVRKSPVCCWKLGLSLAVAFLQPPENVEYLESRHTVKHSC